MIRITHLVDDVAMGGVMVALKNFEDPRLADLSYSEQLTVNPKNALAPRFDTDCIIIHFTVNWVKLPFMMMLRRLNPKARIILIEHSYTRAYEEWNVPSVKRFRRLLQVSYACVDEVVAVSNAQAAWLSRIAPAATIKAIPQSRCLEHFSKVPSRSAANDTPLTIGAIGRFHDQKGFDDLIRAFRAGRLNGARLVLAGYGEREEQLRVLADGCDRISFMGPVENPAAFYASVDCVVIPSRWEAFGLVASEAMAAGKYVIATDIDGLSEQVRGYGMLVLADNISALLGAMQDASAMDRETMICAGEEARFAALSRYDRMIDQWAALLTGRAFTERPSRASSAAALSPMPTMIRPGQ